MSEVGTDQDHGRQARILIVDDEPANVHLLERILFHSGYSDVRTTVDSRTVAATVDDWHADLVLLDLVMPPPDGFAILEQLRAARPRSERIPILVLTGDATGAAKERAFGLGASDILTKPFDRFEVVLRIRNLLATRHFELALRDQNDALEARVAERTMELSVSLEELSAAMDERQALVSRLVTAQEEERRRIASDIHDDTIQTMVAAAMRIELLGRALEDSPLAIDVDRLATSVRDAIRRLRDLLFDVHPATLEREGLVASLRTYLERMEVNGGPLFRLDAPDEDHVPEMRTTMYRIAQEALSNVRRHAAAGLVRVSLHSRPDGVLMRIVDDGVGFDAASVAHTSDGHLGITTMRERAALAGGECRVDSAPGRGTTVEVWLPAAASPPAHVPAGVPPVTAEAGDQ
ncbi:MAG: ATP-binding response regulator [Actinomycetota bacterium]